MRSENGKWCCDTLKCDLVVSCTLTDQTCPVFDGERVYAMDRDWNVHIYDVQSNKWSIVKEKKDEFFFK